LTTRTLSQLFADVIRELAPTDDEYVPLLVNRILQFARQHRASDVHLTPESGSVVMKWRIDGVLQRVANFDQDLGSRLVARTKVLAGLLTYRTGQPQEGRMTDEASESRLPAAETRVATFPTLYGERAAIRLFADTTRLQRLNDLHLPADICSRLRQSLQQTAGVVLLAGPSGSGKTTTIYACLREILATAGESRSLMTLEDPIEQAVTGVTQSQVRPSVQFDLAAGLRAMLRQDPDVIMVGEIRDIETAEQVFRAALTGHLVLTTFHAGSSAEAVARLVELGIDPWLLRSTLGLIVCQRLIRETCGCRTTSSVSHEWNNLSDNQQESQDQNLCDQCSGTGYRGRFVLGESLMPGSDSFASGLLQRADTLTLQTIAKDEGMITLADRAAEAVSAGRTTSEEIYRVLGRGH
jgi:type II secretory ATPase GspE/PulE/Tfp pilus assembly ATPase PilB-like protein